MLETNHMTKTQNNYAQKLQDPRWQRKRLEVMQAAGWACVICGDKDEELNVHHPAYSAYHEPWEYSNLQCICRTCHTIQHLPKQKLMLHAKQMVTEHVVITHRTEFLNKQKEWQKKYLYRQDFEGVLFLQNFIKESADDYDLLICDIEKRYMKLEVFLSLRTKIATTNAPSLEQMQLVDRKIEHRNRLKKSSVEENNDHRMLSTYCRQKQNGGVITGARLWTEKSWCLVLAEAKIPGESLLWTWIEDDLHLVGFTDGEVE